MPKTIDNKCREGKHKLLRWIGNQEGVGNENECKHEIIRSIGTQKGVGNLNNFFYCHYCTLRAKVTDKYRKVLNDVYELISEEK